MASWVSESACNGTLDSTGSSTFISAPWKGLMPADGIRSQRNGSVVQYPADQTHLEKPLPWRDPSPTVMARVKGLSHAGAPIEGAKDGAEAESSRLQRCGRRIRRDRVIYVRDRGYILTGCGYVDAPRDLDKRSRAPSTLLPRCRHLAQHLAWVGRKHIVWAAKPAKPTVSGCRASTGNRAIRR